MVYYDNVIPQISIVNSMDLNYYCLIDDSLVIHGMISVNPWNRCIKGIVWNTCIDLQNQKVFNSYTDKKLFLIGNLTQGNCVVTLVSSMLYIFCSFC